MEPTIVIYPQGRINTKELGQIEWRHWGESMCFTTPDGIDNLVNSVQMRIRFTCKLEGGQWKRDHLSANRVGGFDDVSWAARGKIEKVLLAEAATLSNPTQIAQARAASAYDDYTRKLRDVEEAKEKVAKLETESTKLAAVYALALKAYEEATK